MRIKKVRFFTAFIIIAMLAISPLAVSANHAWGNYHWARTSNPFTLKVGDNVTSAWDPYLNEAISDWTASSVLNLTKVTGGSNPKNCRPTSGRIEVCNSKYGNNGWLGIAQIWANGDHITQAVAKMNDTYYSTPAYNTPAWRRLVMCQEIAHDFGLDHQDEGFSAPNLGTCMDYTNDPDGGGAYGPSNEHPNAHDFAQLETIYAHLDSTTTISAAPAGFMNADVHAVENWGTKVAESANGRSALFVRDFGNGYKIFTHVFWVIE